MIAAAAGLVLADALLFHMSSLEVNMSATQCLLFRSPFFSAPLKNTVSNEVKSTPKVLHRPSTFTKVATPTCAAIDRPSIEIEKSRANGARLGAKVCETIAPALPPVGRVTVPVLGMAALVQAAACIHYGLHFPYMAVLPTNPAYAVGVSLEMAASLWVTGGVLDTNWRMIPLGYALGKKGQSVLLKRAEALRAAADKHAKRAAELEQQ